MTSAYYVCTHTVYANLGPWVSGPQVPGSSGPQNIASPSHTIDVNVLWTRIPNAYLDPSEARPTHFQFVTTIH